MQLGTLVSNMGPRSLLLGCPVLPSTGPTAGAQQLDPRAEVDGQQTAGGPGSPNATTTFAGRYLLPGLNSAQSSTAWAATVVPLEGAPNILPIMTNDVGFAAAPSTFGGVIPTPILGRITDDGLCCTNLHSTALRSLTRAVLITGGRR